MTAAGVVQLTVRTVGKNAVRSTLILLECGRQAEAAPVDPFKV